MRIVWTLGAVADVESVTGPLRDRLVAKVELLAQFPGMGAAMDGPYEGYRQILIGPYRVIYQVAEEEVRIAYVRHGARQLGLRLVRDDK